MFAGGRRFLTYLNTDALLCFDIEDANCDAFGGNEETQTCVRNTDAIGKFAGIKKQYGRACEEFLDDEGAFLQALFSAYLKMVDAAPCGKLVTPA